MATRKGTAVNVRMEDDLADQLHLVALRNGRPVSEEVRAAVRMHLLFEAALDGEQQAVREALGQEEEV